MAVLLLRGFIVVLGVTGIWLIMWTARPRYRDEPDAPAREGFVLTRLGVAGVLAAIVYGTIESHVLDVPPAPRLWVLAIALVWLNYGLMRRMRDRAGRDRE